MCSRCSIFLTDHIVKNANYLIGTLQAIVFLTANAQDRNQKKLTSSARIHKTFFDNNPNNSLNVHIFVRDLLGGQVATNTLLTNVGTQFDDLKKSCLFNI